jgi:hypothetical protein
MAAGLRPYGEVLHLSESDDEGRRGFPSSDGPILKKRDIEAEERILEEFLGTLDERRARRPQEIVAEVAAAIERLGRDWGRPEYGAELDVAARAKMLLSALADPEAVSVVDGYLAHLQEHRAEFLQKVIHPTSGGHG